MPSAIVNWVVRCGLLLSLSGVGLQAGGLEPLSLDSLTQQADIVLQGTVLSKTCQRDPSGRIYTKVEFQVADVWKGAIPGTPFMIVQGGGILGERQSVVAGQAQFDIGEEIVVFLVRNGRGEALTVGLQQGKFHVWRDTATGRRYAVNAFHGVPEAVGHKVRLQGRSTASPELGTPLELTEFKKRVVEGSR